MRLKQCLLFHNEVVLFEFRYLFFSDWDTLNGEPGLERAYMDGTNRYGIIRTKLGWPAGITLDLETKRVYWVDSRYDYIETTTYDGLHRYLLGVAEMFYLEMHADFQKLFALSGSLLRSYLNSPIGKLWSMVGL